MTWEQFLLIWIDQIDRISHLFPYTEPAALNRFRGNIDHFATYIADTHDLTLAEGRIIIEDRLLVGICHPVPVMQAAE